MDKFILHSQYKPTGDQPQAIAELTDGVNRGFAEQTLLGVTGSGSGVQYDQGQAFRAHFLEQRQRQPLAPYLSAVQTDADVRSNRSQTTQVAITLNIVSHPAVNAEHFPDGGVIADKIKRYPISAVKITVKGSKITANRTAIKNSFCVSVTETTPRI